jgi:hypothetical protein
MRYKAIKILTVKSLCFLVIVLGISTPVISAPSYANWTLDPSGNNGTGSFASQGGRNFTFTLTGQHDPASTLIDNNDVFDEATWEALYGQGDNQESLRFGKNPSASLTVSTVSIDFASPVIASSLSFAVTDLEGEDAVISASLNGNPVPTSNIAMWFQGLFDSKPATTGSPHLPSGFDANNSAVVAEFDADGLLSNEIFSSPGTESASGWFSPNEFIDNLTITHRNRFGGAASMHIYMAVVDAPSIVTTSPSSGSSLLIPPSTNSSISFINSGTAVGLIQSCTLASGIDFNITMPSAFPITIPANGSTAVTVTALGTTNDSLNCTYVDSSGISNISFTISALAPVSVPVNSQWMLFGLMMLLFLSVVIYVKPKS